MPSTDVVQEGYVDKMLCSHFPSAGSRGSRSWNVVCPDTGLVVLERGWFQGTESAGLFQTRQKPTPSCEVWYPMSS